MALPTINIDVMMSHPGGVCAEYSSEMIRSFFAGDTWDAIEILTFTPTKPSGEVVSLQDRMYHILRPEVMTQSALDEFDAWVSGTFMAFDPNTLIGINCKAQWFLLNTPFKRADILAHLYEAETGSSNPVKAKLLEILEAV